MSGQNRLILAGHAFANLSAVAVKEDGAAAGSFTPAVQTSGAGAPYTYVQSLTEFRAADGAYTFAADPGGVARSDALGSATRTAADVLRYLLTASKLRIDWPRTERALQRLAGWTIGIYLDDAAPAIDVVREQLLPWLPIIELRGGDGTWFAYADPLDLPIETRLILGQNLVGRLGGMETTDRDAIRNSFAVIYGRDEFLGEFTDTVTVNASNDAACALSDQLFGTLADDARECPITWDAVTARRIGRFAARRLALPRRILRYLAAADLYWLRAGMGVAITDADYSINEVRGVVRSVRRGGPLEVVVELLDGHPAGAL